MPCHHSPGRLDSRLQLPEQHDLKVIGKYRRVNFIGLHSHRTLRLWLIIITFFSLWVELIVVYKRSATFVKRANFSGLRRQKTEWQLHDCLTIVPRFLSRVFCTQLLKTETFISKSQNSGKCNLHLTNILISTYRYILTVPADTAKGILVHWSMQQAAGVFYSTICTRRQLCTLCLKN